MWNRYRQTQEFSKPWLLRFFDQIRFYEVSHEELDQICKDFPHGNYSKDNQSKEKPSPVRIEESTFSLSEYQTFIEHNSDSIDEFKDGRNEAFEMELANWHANGQFHFDMEEADVVISDVTWNEDAVVIDSPVSGSVWQTQVSEGDQVEVGQLLVILESMKMEIPIYASSAGVVSDLLLKDGSRVNAGQALVVLESLLD